MPPVLALLSCPVPRLGLPATGGIPQSTLLPASTRSREKGGRDPRAGVTAAREGVLVDLTASLELLLQRNCCACSIAAPQFSRCPRVGIAGHGAGQHRQQRRLPLHRERSRGQGTGKRVTQVTTTLLPHPDRDSQLQLLPGQHRSHGLEASALPSFSTRGPGKASPYLLRGYLGLRRHRLAQPGHGPGDGHGHADAHAVGALALVHHGDVERPAGSRGTAWGELPPLQGHPPQPRHPGCCELRGPADDPELCSTQPDTRVGFLKTFLTTWAAVACSYKQKVFLEKNPRVKNKTLHCKTI